MKLAIFDIDGTILRSHGMGNRAYMAAFHEELGIGPISTNWHEYRHSTDSGIYHEIFERHFGRRGSEQEYSRLRERYRAIFAELCSQRPDPVVLLPGVREFLRRLAATGQWAVAIASGNWRTVGELKLQLAGIPHQELPSGFADDHVERHGLIDAAHRRAKENYGRGEFSKVVYVGDGPWDVAATQTLRMPFLGVRDDGSHETLRKLGAGNVITNYSDPDDVLDQLERCQAPAAV